MPSLSQRETTGSHWRLNIFFVTWQQKKWKYKLAPKQIVVWFLKIVAANLLSKVLVDSNDGQLVAGPDWKVTIIWWSALNLCAFLHGQ